MEKCCRAEQATDDNIIRSMHFACWIPKAADTYTEYVMFIALTRQQSLLESVSVLGYTYIVSLVTVGPIPLYFQ